VIHYEPSLSTRLLVHPPGSALDWAVHVAAFAIVAIPLVVAVRTLPWSDDELLALRRVGIATGAVLADRVRRWRGGA
jgi:hypothetical protein